MCSEKSGRKVLPGPGKRNEVPSLEVDGKTVNSLIYNDDICLINVLLVIFYDLSPFASRNLTLHLKLSKFRM
jgi:hypothetical protein